MRPTRARPSARYVCNLLVLCGGAAVFERPRPRRCRYHCSSLCTRRTPVLLLFQLFHVLLSYFFSFFAPPGAPLAARLRRPSRPHAYHGTTHADPGKKKEIFAPPRSRPRAPPERPWARRWHNSPALFSFPARRLAHHPTAFHSGLVCNSAAAPLFITLAARPPPPRGTARPSRPRPPLPELRRGDVHPELPLWDGAEQAARPQRLGHLHVGQGQVPPAPRLQPPRH